MENIPVTTKITLSVTIARETREVEFAIHHQLGLNRAWSTSAVAVCRRNGGKLWPCVLRAFQEEGKWKVCMHDVRLNKTYQVTAWREESNKPHESRHNGR